MAKWTIWLLIIIQKYFWAWFQIRQGIKLFMHSVCSQYTYRFVLHILYTVWTDSFLYSQYTNRFIPHIQQICTAKFCLKIYLIPCILHLHTDSLCIFTVYEQIHSANSQYKFRVILRICQTHRNNFEYFKLCKTVQGKCDERT